MEQGSKLKGKTAIITGGSGAICSASARHLLEDGAAVLLMGRRMDALERAKASLLSRVRGGVVELCTGDAGVVDDVQRALHQAYAIADRLDIIVAGVGGGKFRPILMHDYKSFESIVRLNLMTTFLAIRYGAPLLPRGGSIVCISSNAAGNVTPWMSAYMAGKGAMEQLSRCAAEELGEAGVRVNVVRPGLTATEMRNTTSSNPAVVDEVRNEIPLGRIGEPDDIAAAVRYLAGPESAWVTGQVIAVDGGGELRKNPRLMGSLTALYGEEALASVLKGKAPVDKADGSASPSG